MTHYEYESGSVYAVPYIKDMVKNLKSCYEDWKASKQDYYTYTNNNDVEILRKFGESVFVEQITKVLEDKC